MADDIVKPQTTTDILPPEPEPVPVVPPPATPEPPVPPVPALDPMPTSVPAPTPAPIAEPSPPSATGQDALVESILETKPNESVIVPPAQDKSHHHSSLPKKSSKGPLIALIALLLLVLPASVYFISQKNQQIADVRSRAWGTGYKECTGASDGNSQGTCPAGYVCHCQDGTACTETRCELPGETQEPCERQLREWCGNEYGNGMTCCEPGYVCNPTGPGCRPGGGDDNGDDDDDDDTTNPTPTPTTGNTPVCQNIKIYKDGTQVSDLTTLRAGDDVVLAVKGNLSPTKAHFRVNGGAWTETTTKNASNEFTLNYTIADGVTDFVIEGEVFTNGAWH